MLSIHCLHVLQINHYGEQFKERSVRMKIRKSVGEKIFDVFNYGVQGIVALMMFYPFWYAFILSFNDGHDAMRGGIYFLPREWTMDNYIRVIEDGALGTAYAVTVSVTVIATVIALLGCSLAAYALSRKTLPFRRSITFFMFITNIVSAGLIPTYLTFRQLGIINTYWVYILPGAISFYNILLIRSFFTNNVPDALNEAACIDGASEVRIFGQIYLPLSMPILATVALFVAVGKWNDWFTGMYYIKDESMIVLGTLLRKMTVELNVQSFNEQQEMMNIAVQQSAVTAESFKMAVLMLTTLPILFIYPFLQKYFVKGVTVGSVKE